jgi:hypothetical protein
MFLSFLTEILFITTKEIRGHKGKMPKKTSCAFVSLVVKIFPPETEEP